MASEPAQADKPEAPRNTFLSRDYGRARPTVARTTARYGNLMRWLKLGLPSVAAILIGLVAIWPQINPRNDRIPLGFASVSKEEIDQLRMVNPRYTGLDGRNQPYSLTADAATQVGKGTNLVELEQPKADITLKNGTWIALTADTGLFSQQQHIIQLTDNVSLFHDAGYDFHTSSAYIDMSAGTAYGQEPIEGQGPFGNIKAQGFRVIDRGERVIFTGKAKMVIYSSKGAGKSKSKGSAKK